MPIIKIHNAKTNEIIEREMNQEELANYNNLKAKAEDKDAKRAALLDKLGITEEEASLLLS